MGQTDVTDAEKRLIVQTENVSLKDFCISPSSRYLFVVPTIQTGEIPHVLVFDINHLLEPQVDPLAMIKIMPRIGNKKNALCRLEVKETGMENFKIINRQWILKIVAYTIGSDLWFVCAGAITGELKIWRILVLPSTTSLSSGSRIPSMAFRIFSTAS